MNDFAKRMEAEIPKLTRYACVLTHDRDKADDLVQEALCRGWTKQHLFRDGDLRAWLFTIMHNCYVNYVRRSVREGTTVMLNDVDLPVNANADRSFIMRDLSRGLDNLPDYQRDVVWLVGVEDTPYDVVAKQCGIPVGTVRSRLWRGRRALRLAMEQ